MRARRSGHVDLYHGTTVADPYRWLEDPDSPETREWVAAQNEAAEAHLATLPRREELKSRLSELWDFERPGTPFRRGGRLFRFYNPGLANQNLLQVSDDGTTWASVLDPNELSDDGTRALNAAAVSRDGRRLAYAVSDGGSDWQTWFVRDLDTGVDLADQLRWSKFSGASWLPDGSGFFYGRYPEPDEGAELTGTNRGQQLWFHRPGTGQADDTLVYERPDEPDWLFDATVSDDATLLILRVARDTSPRSLLLARRLDPADPLAGTFTPITPAFESSYEFLDNDGDTLDLLTDRDAPRGRIIRIDLTAPDVAAAQELVAETDDRIDHVTPAGAGYLIARLEDAAHRLTWVDRSDGTQIDVPLPPLGSVVAVSGQPGDTDAWVGYTDVFTPITPYAVDLSHPEAGIDVAPAATVDIAFSPDGFVSHRRFATSQDGTRVPYFVVHRADLEPTGDHPTLMYGYGGFDISLTPTFSVARLPWLEAGGVYVLCILRGGGEYGETWHEGGILDRKQNVFDDLYAIADDLIATGISSPDHLAVEGGSNGGLLVGAAITQRPDLFAAAHAAVGVMDMLRFHLFTIGWAWCSDYGSSDDPDQFRTLLAYSPLHNVTAGTAYPATIITTGDHDDRVVPAHSFKFTAELQHGHAGDAPVIARIQTRAGHGAGKPTALLIEEHADVLAFLLDATS